MFHKLLTLLFCLLVGGLSAQPGTEVYLFDISETSGSISLSNPRNISNQRGYDNQPSFTSDGYLLYTSWRDGNPDIVKCNLLSGEKIYLTKTEAGEYSPTPMKNQSSFSAISLEGNGRQLLREYSVKKKDQKEGKVLVPYLKIGYHTWLDSDQLFAFVLGPHPTLQWINLPAQRAEVIDDDIGRSLHIIPESSYLSYVKKLEDKWVIKQYDLVADTSLVLTDALDGSEDMCWYDSTTLLMGRDGKLFSWSNTDDWQEVADLSKWSLSGITRLAVSLDRRFVAIVVNEN